MLKGDVGKTVTVTVVSYLIKKHILKIPGLSLDNKLMVSTLATIGGFAIYDFVGYRFDDKLGLKGNKKAAWVDILKFGSMMVGKEFILSQYKGEEFQVNKLKNIGIALLSFVLYDLFVLPRQPKLATESKYEQGALGDTIKTVLTFIITDFIPDFDIEMNNLPAILGLLVSVPIFHTIVRPMISN
tara:strand:- start:25 stop:579 length:555 start_codon:yes stop_codon:yes gene_type:complete